MWQTFVQESIRGVSPLGITFEISNNPSIADLTNHAYNSLDEKGGIRLSDGHACSECTQDYKATADYAPQNNDPAALLSVDNDEPVPALAGGNPDILIVPIQVPNAGATTTQSPVKMVVINGIVMGLCCYKLYCRCCKCSWRSILSTHVTLFRKKCCVVGRGNRKVGDTEACALHQQDWFQHKQSRSKSILVGIHRMLNQGENFPWNKRVE